MRKTAIAVCLAAVMVCPTAAIAQAPNDVSAQIAQLKQQVEDLQKKLDLLEKAQENSPQPVRSAFLGDKIKIDGRMFVGTLGTGANGPYRNWSTDIPDAKLRFTFQPWKNLTIVNRLSTSGAQAAGFDYFYMDFNGLPGTATTVRLGQRKIDVGQETWTDNPMENFLVSNSISHVSGYGIGAALLGKLGAGKLAPLYEIGFVNGPKGVTVRPSTGLPFNIKLGKPLSSRLFVSANYFETGKLNGTDGSAISIAELSSAPAGTTDWNRRLFEFDARYNYGTTGIRNAIPSYDLPRFMAGATWGAFNDNIVGADNRSGEYWFAEAIYNFTGRLYAAARYSTIVLGSGQLAKLGKSPVAVNAYCRSSFGLGYRLSDLTDLKVEYTDNEATGGASEPHLNQWAVGAATKF